jgi:hypothetical protein
MSMKRTKQRGAGKDKDVETDFWAKPTAPEKTWEEAMDGQAEDAFLPYALSTTFTKGQLVLHVKFGKGLIVEVEPSRVEILFQEGKKKLGHGQAS